MEAITYILLPHPGYLHPSDRNKNGRKFRDRGQNSGESKKIQIVNLFVNKSCIMKNILILLTLFLLSGNSGYAQVAINSDGSLPDNSAMLDVISTDKGILLPRMTQSQRNALASPATGLTVYQTDNTPGIYYNSGTSGSPLWIMAGTGSFWNLTGNTGTTVGTNFLGTTNGQPLMLKVNNQKAGYIDYDATKANTGFGYQTLNSNTSGVYNTANGYKALISNASGNYNTASGMMALYSNSSGNQNTANGYAALYNNTTANQNTAIGYQTLFTQSYNPGTDWNSGNVAVGHEALYSNQPTSTANGINNTAVGNYALRANTTGAYNTANGYAALYSNITGAKNTANGQDALYYNTAGNNNTANGYDALVSNNTGSHNTASGVNALYSNTSGSYNTANGKGALYSNTTGYENTASGEGSLFYNTTASRNTAIGNSALLLQSYDPGSPWVSNNVAVGYQALFSNQPTSTAVGINNTAVGNYALYTNTTGIYNTASGMNALFYNTMGGCNTANASFALYHNTTGSYNTANGYFSLYTNTIGSYSTATGAAALFFNSEGQQNTAHGYYSLYNNTTGNYNTANGFDALANNVGGSYNTAIGIASGTAYGYPNLNNTIGIGNYGCQSWASNLALFGGLTTTWNGGNVTWSTYSDARVKNNVQEDVKGLDFITRLRPVTYYRNIKAMAEITGNKEISDYPEKYDIEKIKFSGFLAQDVEQAAREANYDFSGITIPKKSNELYTLSYEQFVVPLVKAVQEQQQQIEELKIENKELKAENAKFEERLIAIESKLSGSK
jgi:hypothetical protein